MADLAMCFTCFSNSDHSYFSLSLSSSSSYVAVSQKKKTPPFPELAASLAAARALLAVDRLGVYPDALAGRAAGGRGRPHAVLDLGGHRHERLLHVGRVLRRGLQEGDAQLVGVFLKE